MLTYLQAKESQASGALVKDYNTGEWINARNAHYIRAVNKFSTPMGWGIAAFRERNHASEFGGAMDFDEMVKILK